MKEFKFLIRGNEYDVEILDVDGNDYKIEVNGSVYDVQIQREVTQSKTPTLVRSRTTTTVDHDRAKTERPDAKKGTGLIKAPLPGTILELKVKEGDEVKVGQELLVMEAMKMENTIKSDHDGVVQSIKVSVEQSVLEGDCIMEIGAS